ncbi:MAG TPA: F0F1 ATP synthase subunit delta [Burkholderiaceae bacterium]|nr:F0F1 ATP synthase subunit delta [Burkholderiaceae bacterium]
MAELATIARPYAEALFKAVGASDAPALSQQMNALAVVAADDRLREFADNPKTLGKQVFDVIAAAVGGTLDAKIGNLLHAVIDNGRLAALPEMAAQFQALVNARSGVSDATIESAFEIDAAQLAQVVATLEKRFGRKLNARVVVDPALIGGIRAIVGDEVLDTSVRARLEQMKVALTA